MSQRLKSILLFFLSFLPPMPLIFTIWKKRVLLLLKDPWIRIRTKEELEFANKFLDYFNKLAEGSFEEKIGLLNKENNPETEKTLKLFLKRVKHISQYEILRQKELLSPEEKQGIKEYLKILKKNRFNFLKYKFNNYLSAEAIWSFSGLKLLPEEEKLKLKNGTLLDLGAYTGDTSIYLSKAFGLKKAYAFEPESHNFKKLNYNAKKFKAATIILVKKALGDKEGYSYMSYDKDGSKLADNPNSGEKIELSTIDNFLRDKNEESIDLIKMDIEGFEFNALKGAYHTIKKYRPILAISVYHKAEDLFDIKPWLEQSFPEHKYKFFITKANPMHLIYEIMLIAY